MLKFLKNIILYLEDPRTPFLNIILTFIGAITLRNFLEQFSTNTPTYLILDVHYSVGYLSLALSLILLFHFATREDVGKIARVVLPCFIILPSVPVIDLLLSSGKGYSITYLLPEIHHDIFHRLIFFFGAFDGKGITPGMRIEIAVVIALSCIYFYIKTNKLLRSVFFALLTYLLIFFYCAMPFTLNLFFSLLGLPYIHSNEIITRSYLLLILPISQALFYLYNRNYFLSIWKDSRALRIVHFLLMIVLGFVFTAHHASQEPTVQWSWIFICAAIVFGAIFSIIVNNIEDYDIDKISNQDRPTVLKTIPVEHYKNIAWIFLGASLVYASAVNFLCFLIILLWITNYFLYSCPPLRLKKILFFSKMVISFNSLLLFVLGYFIARGTIFIPQTIALFILVCFTAVINFIDIKDYAGDKNAGIITLPTLLGLERSKLVIGIFFLITYFLTSFLLKDIRLLPVMMTIGLFIFLQINKKDYSEKPVFITYLLSIILLIAYLYIK